MDLVIMTYFGVYAAYAESGKIQMGSLKEKVFYLQYKRLPEV
jgi:hypothetical protein